MIDIDYFSKFDTGHFDKSGHPMSFTFVDNNADNLVVTVGCSWTWGANMTPTDDAEHRLANNFGRILSNDLNADWLLLGQVGTGNFWISQKVQEFVKLIPTLHYKKIYIICTFTEIGRQCGTELDQHINYKEYFKTNTYGTDLLKFLNKQAVEEIISTVKPCRNVTLRIGTNFVDHIGFDTAEEYLVPTPWLETLCLITDTAYTGPCYTIGHRAIDGIRKLQPYTHDRFGYTLWLTKLIEGGQSRIHLCQSCNLLMPHTGHPGAEGHNIWAKEILKTL
jgi:hypothetical protein